VQCTQCIYIVLTASDIDVSEAGYVDPYSSCDEDDEEKPADGLSPQTTGNEDTIVSQQVFDEPDEAELIPDDFYYNYEEHASKAAVSDESGLPPNLLTL